MTNTHTWKSKSVRNTYKLQDENVGHAHLQQGKLFRKYTKYTACRVVRNARARTHTQHGEIMGNSYTQANGRAKEWGMHTSARTARQN